MCTESQEGLYKLILIKYSLFLLSVDRIIAWNADIGTLPFSVLPYNHQGRIRIRIWGVGVSGKITIKIYHFQMAVIVTNFKYIF